MTTIRSRPWQGAAGTHDGRTCSSCGQSNTKAHRSKTTSDYRPTRLGTVAGSVVAKVAHRMAPKAWESDQ